MNHLKLFLFLFVVAFAHWQAHAQSGVTLTVTPPSGFTVCSAPGAFVVQIHNGSTGPLLGTQLSIDMPPGMEYVPNSIVGATVSNGNNVNVPIFALAGTVQAGASASFSYQARASCAIIAWQASHLVQDAVTLTHLGGTIAFQPGTYNVLAPNLAVSINPATVLNAAVGQVVTRTVTVTNSGLGAISGFELVAVNGAGLDFLSSTTGIATQVGNTTTIAINSNHLPGGILPAGGQFTVTLRDSVVACAGLGTDLSVRWGCNGANCQVNTTSATVVISALTPLLKFEPTSPPPVCLGTNTPQSLKIKNIGAGPATNVGVVIYQANINIPTLYTNGLFSRLVVGSLTMTIGNTTIPLVPTSTVATLNTGDRACLGAGAIGQMTLQLPNIPAGDSIVLHWDTYNCCPTMDDFDGDFQRWGYDPIYANACGTTTYNPAPTAVVAAGESYRSIEGPYDGAADMNAGDVECLTFTSTLILAASITNVPHELRFVCTLPVGLVPANANPISFSGLSGGTTTITGDSTTGMTITLEFSSGIFTFGNDEVIVCLRANCLSGEGTKLVNLKVEFEQGDACTNACVVNMGNRTEQVFVHCPPPCTRGLEIVDFNMERTTFGTITNPALVNEHRVMYFDRMHFDAKGLVHADAGMPSFPNGYLDLAFSGFTSSSAANTLESIGQAQVRIYDAGTATTYICQAPIALSGNLLRINMSPAALGACLPNGFLFENGDSIRVEGDLRVKRNIGNALYQANATASMYLSQVSNPAGNARYQCGTYGENFSVVGYYFVSAEVNQNNASSCGITTLNEAWLLGVGPSYLNYEGGNFFPGETRVWANMDKITVTLPAGYRYVANGSTGVWRRTTGVDHIWVPDTIPLPTPTQVGNQYTFDIGQLFASGALTPSDDGWRFILNMNVQPSCGVVPNTLQSVSYSGRMRIVPSLASLTADTIDNTADNIIYTAPQLAFVPPLPVQGITSTAVWNFSMINQSNSASANNTWFAIQSPSGNLSNIVLRRQPSNTIINPNVNGLYELNTIPNSANLGYSVTANYNSCTPDSLVILAGWNCAGYPSSVANAVCSPIRAVLRVTPQPGTMQSTLTAVQVPQPICTPFQYEVRINSSGIGSIFYPIVDVLLPQNMSVVSNSAQLLYPVNNAPVAVSGTAIPGGYRFDLRTFNSSILANGLPGGGVNLPQSQAILRFSLSPECGYISGDEVQFKVRSINNCGDTLRNAFTHLPQIQGATSPNTSAVQILVVDTLEACDQAGTMVKVSMCNLGPNVAGSNDSVFVDLPAGIPYISGSYVGLQNAPSTVTVSSGATTRLAVAVPAGLPVDTCMEFAVMVQNLSLLHGQTASLLAQAVSASRLYCATNNDTCTVLTRTGSDQDTVVIWDGTPPQAVCQNATLQLNGAGTANIAVSQIDNGSTDDCGIATMSINASGFFCADLGANVVTLSVIDIHGNMSSCDATVTIEDLEIPVIVACPADTTVLCGAPLLPANPAFLVVTDNCSAVTKSYADQVSLGPCAGNIVRTWTATDGAGNSASCTQTLTRADTIAPLIECQTSLVINALPGLCGAYLSSQATATDNCDLNPVVQCLPGSATLLPLGMTTVVATASDACGNVSSCSYTVTVVDQTAPSAICANVSVTLDTSGQTCILASQVGGGSTDNCGIAAMALSQNCFTCSNAGNNSVTLTVTDASGNATTCSATVTVVSTAMAVTLSSPLNACGYNVTRCCSNRNGAEGHDGSGSGEGSDAGHGNCHHSQCSNFGHATQRCQSNHGNLGSGSGEVPPCGNDGCVTANVSGGCPPYAFLWSNGVTTASQCSLGVGIYRVTVTDGGGHATVQSITLTQAPLLVVTAMDTQVTCYGARNGSVLAQVNGGCPPYNYNWSNGAHTQTISNLASGSYRVTVTDANGCRANTSVIVTQPTRLTVDAGPHRVIYPAYAPQACATLIGSAGGGTPAYSARWTLANGLLIGTSMSVTVCPSVRTVYYLQVTDARGCIARDSVLVCPTNVSCGNNLIQICHRSPGSHGNGQTLCVPASTVASHLNHGDALGACRTSPVCGFPVAQGQHGSGSGYKSQTHVDSDSELVTMEAFPNPTGGKIDVQVTTGNLEEDAIYQLQLTDLTGKMLLQTPVHIVDGRFSKQLDLSGYASGIYQLSIETPTHTRLFQRIVKN